MFVFIILWLNKPDTFSKEMWVFKINWIEYLKNHVWKFILAKSLYMFYIGKYNEVNPPPPTCLVTLEVNRLVWTIRLVSYINLLTVDQLAEMSSFAWIFHALLWFASSLFRDGHITSVSILELCVSIIETWYLFTYTIKVIF